MKMAIKHKIFRMQKNH